MARLYLPPAGTRLSTGWDVPKALLGELLALPQGVIMVNFNTGGTPVEDRQVDLAVLTPRALHVVEIKNHRKPVIVSPNGHWFIVRKDGTKEPIVNRRGREQETPAIQAQRNAQALRKALRRYVDWPQIPIYSYVLFPYLHRKSRIESSVFEGVIICKSIEEFLGALAYNENRSSPRIPPHVLDALPQALGLEDKSQDFKVGGTVLYRVWQRRGAPPEAPELPEVSEQAGAYARTTFMRDLRTALAFLNVGLFTLGVFAPVVGSKTIALWARSRGLESLPDSQGAFLFGALQAPMLVGTILGGRHSWKGIRWFFGVLFLVGLLVIIVMLRAMRSGKKELIAGILAFSALSLLLVWRFSRIRPFFYGWTVAWLWLIFGQ